MNSKSAFRRKVHFQNSYTSRTILCGACALAGISVTPTPITFAANELATAPASEPAANEDPVFTVTQFHIDYFYQGIAEHWRAGLTQMQIVLCKRGEIFAGPAAGGETAFISVKDLTSNTSARKFHGSALLAINNAIRDYFQDQGLLAVKVYIDPADIQEANGSLQDARSGGDTDLHIVVLIGHVTQVRTISSGNRVPADKSADNPVDARILQNSPIHAGASRQPTDESLLRKKELDDYLNRINRQPGRRVDASISQADQPGSVALNYLVQENRPWDLYAQISNTGTRDTKELRERFGFLDTQLTDNDDVLSLDYVTANFDPASQVVMGSYEFPILDSQTLLVRTYASYSSFVASDVGLATEDLSGNQAVAGLELIDNIYQHHDFFVDAFGGMRYEGISSSDDTTGIEGSADFGIPYIGLRAQRTNQISSLLASVTAETGFTRADQAQLNGLGRTDIDKRWGLLQADMEYSFFIEPLLWPRDFAAGRGMLANEFAFSVRGQSAMGSRLVPEEQQTVGGLYTVRGYPESLTAGDDAIIASAEYRLHIPRVFNPNPNPKPLHIWGSDNAQPFRWVPDRPGGQTDWDLIFKAFVDGAQVWQSNRMPGEEDSSLLSTGVGLEFQFKQCLNAQIYWGVALQDVTGPSIDDSTRAGDSRVGFSITLFY